VKKRKKPNSLLLCFLRNKAAGCIAYLAHISHYFNGVHPLYGLQHIYGFQLHIGSHFRRGMQFIYGSQKLLGMHFEYGFRVYAQNFRGSAVMWLRLIKNIKRKGYFLLLVIKNSGVIISLCPNLSIG